MDHAASASQHDDRLNVAPSRWRDVLALTKPGIIGGNLIATLGGYFLAAHGTFDWVTFASVMMGIALVIASGCACNNVIDRDIDALMARTRHRPLAKGRISITQALGISALLGVAGVTVILLVGFSPAAGAALGVLLLALAVQLRGRRRKVVEPVGEPGGEPEPAAAPAPGDNPAAPSQKP
nr:UbiA family prenyltransferase [uncultured Halomonas sp.]